MLRMLGEGGVLFLLPFMAYAILLVAQNRFPFVREAWGSRLSVPLAAAGLGLAIVGLLVMGTFGERHRGAYLPAHIEHGKLVPGHMQ